MGVSLVVSLKNRLRHAVPRRHLVFHVLQRSFILILLGIILNSHGNPATLNQLRFPGVLQRIGITYLIVGLLEIAFTKRTEIIYEVRFVIQQPQDYYDYIFVASFSKISARYRGFLASVDYNSFSRCFAHYYYVCC